MSEALLSFTVAGNPRPKARPRFGRGFTYTTAGNVTAEKTVAWEARLAQVKAQCGEVTAPVRVELEFHLATARRVDVDNLAKLVLDALNGVVWRDDSLIAELRVSKGIDRVEPRTVVRVFAA